MRFGATLRASVYGPWRDKYIDYSKLKKLLRDDEDTGHEQKWTEDDEAKFVEELLNTQLEQVNAFHDEKHQDLRARTTKCEQRFQGLPDLNDKGSLSADQIHEITEIIGQLDSITEEVNELQKYSRVNYTGFLKAAKKHDRRRGKEYKVRPLLQVRLASLPFNSEDYSPLLYELSTMYSIARELQEPDSDKSKDTPAARQGREHYTSHKFWVHSENLLEAKTYILRRLPVLVYNAKTSKDANAANSDPFLNSLYFDNSKFSLYRDKCETAKRASSLRLRWFGQLNEKPQIFVEKKTVDEHGDSEETRATIKAKHVQAFIDGQYKMEKEVAKLHERQDMDAEQGHDLARSVGELQAFIKDNNLEPVLRASYQRTAFQIPGDDRVRISIDTDLAFIREDALDQDRPCRNPHEWHRKDVDQLGLKYPFDEIKTGEVSRFPHALLEIKVNKDAPRKTTQWVTELMSSHLVKEAPKFSKFVHGVAQLFEDHVNTFPFWLSELETDIRREPEEAYRIEQERKIKLAADKHVVGSLLGSKNIVSFKSPIGSATSKQGKRRVSQVRSIEEGDDKSSIGELSSRMAETTHTDGGMFSSGMRTLSNSRYARAQRVQNVTLPPGVKKPQRWIKDMNPVRVEPKVWLANQRTFVKWQHVSILLTTLSLGLYNAAGEDNNTARGLAVMYTIIALFAAGWGWWMYIKRSRMIEARSGKDFDNVAGPIIVCIALIIALCINFAFKYQAALDATLPPSHDTVSWTKESQEL